VSDSDKDENVVTTSLNLLTLLEGKPTSHPLGGFDFLTAYAAVVTPRGESYYTPSFRILPGGIASRPEPIDVVVIGTSLAEQLGTTERFLVDGEDGEKTDGYAWLRANPNDAEFLRVIAEAILGYTSPSDAATEPGVYVLEPDDLV
jgi:hypothetical protein